MSAEERPSAVGAVDVVNAPDASHTPPPAESGASPPTLGPALPQGAAPASAPKPEPTHHSVPGLTNTLPPEDRDHPRIPTLPPEHTAVPRIPTLPPDARPEHALGPFGSQARQGEGAAAGLLVTAGIHLALVLAVLFAGRSEGRTTPRPPKEMVIETHILEVQAGSPEGMRETGPAYKRREGARPQGRQPPNELHLGTSGRPARRLPSTMGPQTPSGPDDAVNVPSDWGSQTGVDAPPGARTSDDRHGAGGTAEKGALDPCFTEHAQVVAGYRAEVSSKIPPMPRPAFITADVAQNLITLVRVAIDAGGKIVSVTIAKSSGNPRFDAATTDHVNAVGSFPAPHKCVMYDKLKGVFRGSVTFSVSIRSR